MSYSTILFLIVTTWLIGAVFWPLFWYVRYKIKEARIYKQDVILVKEEAERQKDILFRVVVSNKLAGFEVVTWMTLWTSVFVALLPSINYLHSTQLEIADRRPWIVVTEPDIFLTPAGEKAANDNPLFITANLQNIGKTPARYDAALFTVKSFSGIYLQSEEVPSGILFPGQTKRIGWIARWNNQDSKLLEWARLERSPEILCTLCGLVFEINYRELRTKENIFLTKTELFWTNTKEGYIVGVEPSFETTDAR